MKKIIEKIKKEKVKIILIILVVVFASLSLNFFLQYSYGSKDDGIFNGNVPACFIKESESQYPGIPVACAGHGHEHEDYFAILNRVH